jgi:ankyrin repeat protein
LCACAHVDYACGTIIYTLINYYEQDNNVDIAKALVSFDARINAVNIDDQTPLDLVARGSELEELLALLGGLRYQELLPYSSQLGDCGVDTFLEETDDDFSTPPESATDLASIQCEYSRGVTSTCGN